MGKNPDPNLTDGEWFRQYEAGQTDLAVRTTALEMAIKAAEILYSPVSDRDADHLERIINLANRFEAQLRGEGECA